MGSRDIVTKPRTPAPTPPPSVDKSKVDSIENSSKKLNDALKGNAQDAMGTVASSTAVLPAIIGIFHGPLALAVTTIFSFITEMIGGGESEVQKMAKETSRWIEIEAVAAELPEVPPI